MESYWGIKDILDLEVKKEVIIEFRKLLTFSLHTPYVPVEWLNNYRVD